MGWGNRFWPGHKTTCRRESVVTLAVYSLIIGDRRRDVLRNFSRAQGNVEAPASATITLDGKRQVSPATQLMPGKYPVRIELDGYETVDMT